MKSSHSRNTQFLHVLVIVCITISMLPPCGAMPISAEGPAPRGDRSPDRPTSAAPTSQPTFEPTIPVPTPTAVLSPTPERYPSVEPTPTHVPEPTARPTVEPPYDPGTSVQPSLPASLAISASPDEGWPGNPITLTLRLQAKGHIDEVTAYGALPEGLTFDAIVEGYGAYLSEEHALLWIEGDLEEGDQRETQVRFLINENAPDVMSLSLTMDSPSHGSKGSRSLTLYRRFGPSEAQITPEEGGTLVSADGRVTVVFPAGAVTETVRVEHIPVRTRLGSGSGEPFFQFELNAYAQGPSARQVTKFDVPLELRVSAAGLFNARTLPYYLRPALSYYDEEAEEWIEIPADRAGTALVAPLEHFTDFGFSLTGIEKTGWLPMANLPTVSTFDGGLRHSIPIEVPEGRGGLTPEIWLNYNSRSMDGILSWTQSDWAGLGWSLDTMEIRRKIVPQYDKDNPVVWDNTHYHNEFTLVYQGTSYRLTPGSDAVDDNYGRYYCEDENFLYIERRNDAGANGSACNDTSEYWFVRDKDGHTYRLGYYDESEQVLNTDYYADAHGDDLPNCEWSDGNPPDTYACYAGNEEHLVAFRWRVDRITNTLDSQIVLTYTEHITASSDSHLTDPTKDGWRECASYLSEIRYNYDSTNTNHYSLIKFITGTRDLNSDGITDSGEDYEDNQGEAFWIQNDYLSSVQVHDWDGDSARRLIREYSFSYDLDHSTDNGQESPEMRTLQAVTEYGLGGVSLGNALPSSTFEYELKWNKAGNESALTTWGKTGFLYPRLVTVTTPISTQVSVDYDDADHSGSEQKPVNYRVDEKTVLTLGAPESGHKIDYIYPTSFVSICYEYDPDADPPYDPEFDYAYGCAVRGANEDDGGTLIGYEQVTEKLYDLDDNPISSTEHNFHLNDETDTVPDRLRLLGREHLTITRDESDDDLLKVETTWVVVTPSEISSTLFTTDTWFVYAHLVSETVAVDGTFPSTPQKVTEYRYDPYFQGEHPDNTGHSVQLGNLTHVFEKSGGQVLRNTRYSYFPNTDAWIISKRASEELFEGNSDDADDLLADTVYLYDGASDWESPPTRGNVTRVDYVTSVSPEFSTISETMAYDADNWYVPVTHTNTLGYTTTYEYDTSYRRPVKVTQDPPGINITTIYEYGYDDASRAMGLVTAITDTNGIPTYARYDAWGRITETVKPGDSLESPTTEYAYGDAATPLAITTTQRLDGSNVLTSVDYYNGLGQLIQAKQVPTDTTEMNITNYTYNAQGQQDRAYLPYTSTYSAGYQSSIPSGTYSVTTDYDALARPIKVINPDETEIETSYNVFTTTVTDANDHVRATGADAYGRVIRVVEYTGTSASPTPYATTEYAYDERDLLTSVTDAASPSNTTTITYDLLGRKTAMDDPDMGEWSYEYDDAGNLIRQEDARGQVTFFDYDALGRLLGKEYCHGSDCEMPTTLDYDVEYTYDNITTGWYGKGRLDSVEVVDEGLTRSYRFDERGRAYSQTLELDAGASVTETAWTYNSADMVKTQTYHSTSTNEIVAFAYDKWGRPDELSGDDGTNTRNYVTGTTYDEFARPTLVSFGDLNRTSFTYYDPVSKTMSGDGQGGRLHYFKTGPAASPGSEQFQSYQYDSVGNIKAIWIVHDEGTMDNEKQEFEYDELDRLTSAETFGTTTAPYTRTFTYNEIGNLTSLYDEGDGTTSYSYGGSAAPPHALATADSSLVAWYDDNGNMMMSKWPDGDYRSLVHDEENRLTFAATSDLLVDAWISCYGPASGGWTTYMTYPRTVADVTGDGRDDIVAHGGNYTYVSISNGSSFGSPQEWTGYFANSWVSQDVHPRLIGDVTGDGMADVVGFGQNVTYVGISTGSSFAFQSTPWHTYFGYTDIDTYDTHPRGLGDVNGDGMADILGFVDSGVMVALSTGSGFGTTSTWTTQFGNSSGSGSWTSHNEYPRLVGDVNGDEKDDIVGFHDEGVHVALSNGSTFDDAEVWLGWFGYSSDAGSWTSFDDYPRMLADVNADGMMDIVGCKGIGIWVSLSVGDRFLPPTAWRNTYTIGAGGWVDHNTFPRVAGDVTGDGFAEFVGFGNRYVYVTECDARIDFSYNADGAMVSAVISDTGGLTTTVYVGDHQQWVDGVATNYYFHNGRRVAMRTGSDVSYLHADHLQSTTDTTGDEDSGPQLHFPYGETRSSAEVATEHQYTGQRWQDALGLYYYNARWYDPQMRRFVQADTLVPEPGNPQSLNRYSYVYNNPIKFMDPSGHDGGAWGAIGMDNPYSVIAQGMGYPDSSEWGIKDQEVQSLTTDVGKIHIQAIDAANKVLGPVVEVGLGAFPVVGPVLDAYELITGETIFGEEVSTFGRGMAAFGLFVSFDEVLSFARKSSVVGEVIDEHHWIPREVHGMLRDMGSGLDEDMLDMTDPLARGFHKLVHGKWGTKLEAYNGTVKRWLQGHAHDYTDEAFLSFIEALRQDYIDYLTVVQ